ncbi:MAG: hypothetical protein OET44_18315 [Gammaproteobacteria bacterium]|nr:hypothetical protein [Gammaproteobacteria bacterium]
MANRLILISCILALLVPLAWSASDPYEDLHTAIRRQSIDEAEDAIKRGAKVDVLVLINCINRSTDMLKAMLKHYDGDIDASHGQINMSALGAATVADNAVAAEILLDVGADMDKPAAYGRSA